MTALEQQLYTSLKDRLRTVASKSIFVCYMDGQLVDIPTTATMSGFKNRVNARFRHAYWQQTTVQKLTKAEVTSVVKQWMKDHCEFKEIIIT